jgi:hypothetical protein
MAFGNEPDDRQQQPLVRRASVVLAAASPDNSDDQRDARLVHCTRAEVLAPARVLRRPDSRDEFELALGEAVATMQLVRSGALLCWLSGARLCGCWQRYQHFALAVRDSVGSAAAASIDEHDLALANESNCVFVGGLGGCGMWHVARDRGAAALCGVLRRWRASAHRCADRRRRRAPGRVDDAQFARLSARKVGCQQR